MVALQFCHCEKTLEGELFCLNHVFFKLSSSTDGLFGFHEVVLCSGNEAKALPHRVGFSKAKPIYIINHNSQIILICQCSYFCLYFWASYDLWFSKSVFQEAFFITIEQYEIILITSNMKSDQLPETLWIFRAPSMTAFFMYSMVGPGCCCQDTFVTVE